MNEENSNPINPEHSMFVRRVLIAVGITVSIVLLLLVMGYAVHVFLLVFAGILLAIFLRGLSNQISKFTPISRGRSLAIVILTLFVIIALSIIFIAPRLAGQVDELSNSLYQSGRELQQYIERYGWGRKILAQMPDTNKVLAGSGGGNVLAKATGIVSTTLGVITDLVVILFVGIYVAVNPGLYTNGIMRLVPIPKRRRAREVLDELGYKLRWWLIGRVASMIAVGALTTIGLWLLGVKLALILGIVTGILEFIPYIGPIIAVIPAAMIALSQSPTMALYVVLLFVFIQSIEGYLLEPLVEQRVVSIPPALTITSQVLFGILVGTLGVMFALPLTIVLIVLMRMLYVEDTLGDRVEIIDSRNKGKKKTSISR